MNFVALKMLFGDRAKYLMLLAGLTFSTMLIVQQGSIFSPVTEQHFQGYEIHDSCFFFALLNLRVLGLFFFAWLG